MSVISGFDPWKNSICTCPDKYSISPYTGCGHGCLYCYASSYIPDFYSPRSKKIFIVRAEKALKKIPVGSCLALSNSSDPYQPLEKKLLLTRELLLLFSNFNLKVMIVTKSSLVARDIDILKAMPQAIVSMTLTTLNPDLAKILEPGAPLPAERLAAMGKLSPHLPVVCRIDPLIPGLNIKEVPALIKELKKRGVKQVITSTYKAKADNFLRMGKAFPGLSGEWQNLYKKQGEKRSGSFYLSETQRKKTISRVKELAGKENLRFSSCREGFPELNTANCDGSSLFQQPPSVASKK